MKNNNNLLKNKYPEIYKQLDFKKNKEEKIDIKNITYASSVKVWWTCKKCGESWKAKVSNRTFLHQNCPFCTHAPKKASFKNSLKTQRPELLKYWDYERNKEIGLTPENTAYQSGKKAWWICEKNKEHRYRASVQLKSMGYGKCTICKAKKRKEKEK